MVTLSTLLILLALSFQLLPTSRAQSLLDAGDTATGNFFPLECNNDLNVTECKSWVSQAFNFAEKVEIPCGECITFDEPDGSHIVLDVGLSVVGKLVFPPNTKATIETPFIFVEGLLQASSNEIINSTNIDGLHFIITGTEKQPFFPQAQNKPSCDGFYCDVGKKPIVVAGGKLDIQGVNETCPTWVKLRDVARDDQFVPEEYPVMPNPPTGCNRIVIHEDFETGPGYFKSSLGSIDSIENEESNSFFKVSGRYRSWQGAFINVDSFLSDCMIPDQTYLVKARYRLIHEGNSSSNCQTNGTDCLALNIHTMGQNETATWKTLFKTPASARSVDGVWTDFIAMVKFDDGDFDSNALYQILYFSGPEEGIRIDIDDIYFSLPWKEHYPVPDDKICNNLIVNGGAEVDNKFAYPFELLGDIGGYLQIKNETVDGVFNRYFSITGRQAAWQSIYQGLIQDCVIEHTIYNFKIKYRVHSTEPSEIRLVLKTTEGVDDFSYESVGVCPTASYSTGWVSCEKVFLFKEKHQNATKVEVQIMTMDNDTADVDYDDFSITLHALPVNKFILSPDIAQCWGVGAQIVQTSHTISHSDYNELNITNITIVDDNAVVSIGTPIAKPTTEADDPRFAVEIALLSRNIAITSKDDDPGYPLHGAHLMVLQTPNVAQKIVGVDIRGSGQQGNEGRYPVHFHMCGNATGTLVARNTVRHSHQRCYVIHATDYITLEYNVAFDTFGHCYMLEDGIEEENSFFHNLGLETKIMPDDGLISIAESDQFAATFWIANPRNYFLGNVAAGSEDNGFWYEFLEVIRGISMKLDPMYLKNPTTIPFGYHRKNVMHSNKGEGFKLYPNGYFPEERAIFEDVMSYRNHGDGILLHNSKNLGVDGGVLADNRRAIDIDKQADDVTVANTVIIGYSDLYQKDVQAGKYQSHCPAWVPLVGIQLHSFLRYRDSKGYSLSNVTFENYGEETGCVGSVAIEMDKQVRDGHFDAYSSFHNLTFPETSSSMERFNMCSLEKNPMFLHDLVIQDDGSLNPTGNGLPGVVISNSTTMTSFVGNCVDMVGSCALYCEGSSFCYRGLNIATWDAPDYEELFLEVTDSEGKVSNFEGYFETIMKDEVQTIDGIPKLVEVSDEYENKGYQRRRYYTPLLPYGNYTMRFKMGGLSYWPQFIEVVWEDSPNCFPHINDDNVNLIIPKPTDSDCSNLIRNAGGEMAGHDFWGHTGGAMEVTTGNALSGDHTITSVKRTNAWHGIGQFLDTRCLTIGRQYEIIVNIRLRERVDNAYTSCNINQINYNAADICPRVVFRARTFKGNNIGDEVEAIFAYPMASAVGPWKADQWNKLYGQFTVTEEFANADSLFFHIERLRGGLDYIMDDVAIQPTSYDCHMPIYNGDFEVGDTRFWGSIGTANIDIISPGYNSDYALRTTSRGEFWSSMSQQLNTECLVEGERFAVNVMVLLLDANNNRYDCTVGLRWGEGANGGKDFVCPTMSLRMTSGTVSTDVDVGSMSGPFTTQEWNSIYGQFTVTASMIEADLVSLYFRKVKEDISIVVDNVVITKIIDGEPGSSVLIDNGDFSGGDLRYYHIYGGGLMNITAPGYDDSFSMEVRNRINEHYGVNYVLSSSSIVAGALYKVSCQIRLVLEDLTTSFYCDPAIISGEKRCPTLSLRSKSTGEEQFLRIIASAPTNFQADQWNEFSGTFQFLTAELQAESLSLVINNAPTNIVMLIDNIKLHTQDFSSNVPSLVPSSLNVS